MSKHAEEAVLVRFVRDTLGCGCPEEVLADICVERSPGAFEGLPVAALLRVGGRLQVVLCEDAPWQAISVDLAAIVAAARRLRDDQGFNRVRVVVASDEATAAADLTRAFAALGEDWHEEPVE